MDVTVHDVDAALMGALAELSPDLVWPLLHGAGGEDGSVRDVLELLGLRYVGTDPRASRVAWSKPISKTQVARAGLATPAFVTLPQTLFRELGAGQVLETLVRRLGLPLVVKPSHGGSALGVSHVERAEDLPRAMVDCFAYDGTALVERAVVGTEVAVSVVDTGSGPVALPAVEIVTQGTYDYDARYNAGRTEYFTPARLSARSTEAAAHAAITAHQTLGLRHLSRTDLIVDPDGVPWFLEVNVAPGMTETSLFPQSAAAAGLSVPGLYADLVIAALAD